MQPPGQEMSSIGTRKPDTVTALIYLDAAFANAFYDPNGGATAQLEIRTMREELEKLPRGYAESPEQIKKVLKLIPVLQKSLERDLATVEGLPQHTNPRPTYYDQVADIMAASRHNYTSVKAPFLAIIAWPPKCLSDCETPAAKAYDRELGAQADAVQADYPIARIVRIPNADHYVFRSNETQVLKEMWGFSDGFPR
jgi:non-heme chloroperoxidase